ncbi:P-loop domain-containing protein [Saccharibacillus alkalitolerans]|uniref:ATP-binding protein n=1 Tax=Saccharibacillus alkalitolerans TaxID=2705290 RepID=A0ABX0FA41_9BACL|nr:ATP-binding protein [Saccharibacillus alkalitolerans]NGZ76909.1 ATP-binding protein [Saccharibacillus alkalitolerans]
MSLGLAHKGYEYQDLLSGLFIIENVLNDVDAVVKIDKKESENDKFDDFTLVSLNNISKKQIKYSDDKIIGKADFSTANYDLALDTLFKSWQESNRLGKTEFRICLAWEYIESDEELDFLYEVECDNFYKDEKVKFLKFNVDLIWERDQQPKSTWRRLRSKSENINRDEFVLFLEDVIVEVNLPKASNDIANPDALEKIVFSKLRQFGVGKYPNHHKKIEDVLLNLTHIVKNARSTGEEIRLNNIVYKLGLKNNYGNINQKFYIDEELNVVDEYKFENFNNIIYSNKKTIILGEPGSGKSWFIQNYIKYLNSKKIKVIQHYCYTGMDDVFEKERITIDIFLANLVNDILISFPELIELKKTKYGVDVEELQNLFDSISEDTVLIIDGLDHIGRIYNFHKAIMKKIETEIIQVLSNFVFTEKLHVVLASQPATDVIELTKQGYETYNIVPWNIHDVQKFLIKNNMTDSSLNKEITLSQILLDKSKGNPLYLKYLMQELERKKLSYISLEFLQKFPQYDNNLTSYYEYLLSLVPNSQKVPQVLAGAPFHLTKKELVEITHLGDYVEESIDLIQSILKQNKCNSGYTIYHESFRRYIIETLEKKNVNVQRLIYDELIEWLIRNGFYNVRKSYLYLFTLLFESMRYDEILKYCNKEFVVDSLFYGNNIESIKKNFEILIKAACSKHDYEELIKCTELSNMIYSLEYSFDENSELYYEVLGLVNGFPRLKNILLYEDQMALNLSQGLKVCYLCSKNNNIPDWEPYIKELRNQKDRGYDSDLNEKELYRYFICACLDLGWDMEERLSKIRKSSLEEQRHIVIEEYNRRNEIDKLIDIIKSMSKNENWNKSLAFFFHEDYEVDLSNITQIFDTLRNVDSYSEESISAVSFYVKHIKRINQLHAKELSLFLEEIKNRNWFFNWFIYIAEMDRALNELENVEFEKNIINAFKWLTYDTEPFKGTPRTCDLYKYEEIIYKSIKEPIIFIKTEKTWNEVLNILKIMSAETTTFLQGSAGGPLPTYKLLNIVTSIANQDNFEIITTMINEIINEEDKYRFYSYLADYSFKNAAILAKAGHLGSSKEAFKKGIVYMLSYSFRKDRTLSHLLDSVSSTYSLDKELGLNNILKLKPLADAVVRHTDGKSTKTYQLEWFKLLVDSDIELALTFLRKELTQNFNYWILEDCMEYLLISSNSTLSPRIENVLFKTFPKVITENFISAYLTNIECLLEENSESIAERSFKELMSRFDSYDQTEYVSEGLVNRLNSFCKRFEVHWNKKISVKKQKTFYPSVDTLRKEIVRRSFTEFSFAELIEYIKEYGISREDSLSVYYYLSQKLDGELDDEKRAFLSGLVYICFNRTSTDSTCNQLIEIVDNLSLDYEKMALLYMLMFLRHNDGWYRRFTQTKFFNKAHKYDSNEAEKTFFEFIYHNFFEVDYSLAVGGEIINGLSTINYDSNLVFKHWNNLYEIINFRLSGQLEYDWKEVKREKEEFDVHEKMFLLLLSRLKYGEANRFKSITSELDDLLKDKMLRFKFVKPFTQFVFEKDKYTDYALCLLLVVVQKRYEFKEIVEFKLESIFEEIYPTQNPTINFLIRSIIQMKHQETYCEYEIDTLIIDERTSYFLDLVEKNDKRISFFGECGINVGKVIEAYVNEIQDEKFVDEKREILYNRVYNVLIPNVYFYDVLTKYLGIEVEKYLRALAGTPFYEPYEISLYSAILDNIPMLISQHTSLGPRPDDLLLPQFVEEGYEEVEMNDWVRVGYIEKWYNKMNKFKSDPVSNIDTITIVSGVGFDGETYIVPFMKLDEYEYFEETEYNNINLLQYHDFKTFLTTNFSLVDDPYLNYDTKQLLGVIPEILQYLSVRMIDSGRGIIGCTKEGEEVIRYSRWENCYIDDSDCLPYLIGSQLLMKKKTFEELCYISPVKPLCYTTKII